jgi:chaperonin GroEL (HSP60 family)
MLVEVAKTMDDEVGDGSTAAILLTVELLANAKELLDINVHPTTIVSGFRLAADKAIEILESISKNVSPEQEDVLIKIAMTAIKGEKDEKARKLAQIAVKAVKALLKITEGKGINSNEIKVEKIESGCIDDSEVILGIVIKNHRARTSMPLRIENARILLLEKAPKIKNARKKSKINEVTSEKIVREIENSSANVIFCPESIDDKTLDYLAKSNILVVKSVNEKDLEKIAIATDAKALTDIEAISNSDLGKTCLVEEKEIGKEKFIFIRDCSNLKSVSVLLCERPKRAVESAEIIFNKAVRVVGAVIEDGKYVAGGVSSEVEVALRLRKYAASLSGREQQIVNKFADALDIVPKTLSENANLDSIDMLDELRSQHEKGYETAGLDVFTGKVVDMTEKGIIEPLSVKIEVIRSATEAASIILRIDDVLSTSKIGSENQDGPRVPHPGDPDGDQ